jgi:hypothetical protein
MIRIKKKMEKMVAEMMTSVEMMLVEMMEASNGMDIDN